MSTITDPASELAKIAERLDQSTNTAGDKFLAEQFGVAPWSTDFVRIILCVLERVDLVAHIVDASSMDDDHKANAVQELDQLKSAFSADSLRNSWRQDGQQKMRLHGRPLQYLSSTVRKTVVYPRLSDEEVEELLVLIDVYLDEIQKESDTPGFVRQAVIDGLAMFRFRLEYVRWMGVGYALAAFREVVMAYEWAGRELRSVDNADSEAVLRGLRTIIVKFKEKVDSIREWGDSAESIWRWYQVASSAASPFLLAGTVSGVQ